MQDLKMTDQVASYESDGPSKSRGVKMQDMKMPYLCDIYPNNFPDLHWRVSEN